MIIEAGKFYANRRGDILGPMDEREPGVFLDQHGAIYRPDGSQWDHAPASMANMIVKLNDEDVSALAAPVHTEKVLTGWQPIETAPMDGTHVDLWVTPPKRALTTGSYGRVADCWFSEGAWWFYNETKYASDPANCRSEVWHVSHWMPRPTPPVPTDPVSGAK